MKALSTIFTLILLTPHFSYSADKFITISGKVQSENSAGLRIATVQSDGKSTVAKVGENKKFRMKLTALAAKHASIHVVSGAGRYVGPVIAPKGNKAATSLNGKFSGNLGNITITDGFAQTSQGREIFKSSSSVSFNKDNGTPGSGNLGLVLRDFTVTEIKADKPPKPSDDTDKDGIPNLIDVDDDGDLILDSGDSNFRAFTGPVPYLFSDLVANATSALNANSQTLSQEMIDAFVKSNLHVVVGYNSAESGEIQSANVDCLGLPYCGTSGIATISGLGEISIPDGFPLGSLWKEFDTDSDGLPNLYVYPGSTRAEIIISPNVKPSEITSGDSLLFKISFAKKTQTFPLVLSFIFVTTPAATSLSDGTTTTNFTYPGSSSDPGMSNNPISLASKNVTVTFWRPQRLPIAGAESGTLIEMGNLKYGVDLAVGSGSNQTIVQCYADDYTNLSPTLSKVASDFGVGIDVLKDSRADSEPDASQTLSFTLNLDSCITRAGISSSGQDVILGLKAKDKTGSNAAQLFSLRTP